MNYELLFKEYRIEDPLERKNTSRIIRYLVQFLLYAFVAAFLAYITSALYDRLAQYYYFAPFAMTCWMLFLIFILVTLEGANTARKSIYDSLDRKITAILPISTDRKIFVKMIYLYSKEFLELAVLSLPVIISFGVKANFPYWYHVAAFIYPLFIGVTSTGLSFILSILFHYLHLLLKDRNIVQFVIASVVVVSLCYLYQFFLDLFLVSISDSQLSGTLSPAFLDFISDGVFYLLPVYNILSFFMGRDNLLSNALVFLGITLLFITIGFLLACHALEKEENSSRARKEVDIESIKIESPLKSLIRKEIYLLFKDSNNTLSYTSILIMLPFLSFVVVSSLDSILRTNLSVFLSLYPAILDVIYISLLLLFVGVMNAGNALKPSNEKEGLKVSKILPYKPLTVILVKLLCPTLLSSVSLILTASILFGMSTITLTVFLISLLGGLLLIVATNLISLTSDMNDLTDSRFKTSFLPSFMAYIVPVAILIVGFVLSVSFFEADRIYMICGLLTLVVLLPVLFEPPGRINKLYVRMEC